MKMQRGSGLFFAALALLAPQVAVSQTPSAGGTDTFIKGATDFLLDRANDNYIYIFQKKLEANPQLQKYLPQTLRVAKAGDIQSLIMHKDLWKNALKADLVGLVDQALNEWDRYVHKLCSAADAPEETCTLAKAEADKHVVPRLKSFVAKQCDVASRKASEAVKKNCEAAEKRLKEADDRGQDAQKKLSGFVAERTKVSEYIMRPGAAKALSDLIVDLKGIKPEACQDLERDGYTGCTIEVLYILRAVAHADYVVNCYLYGNMCSNGKRDEDNANQEEDDDFKDFRRYALFFAQLADAAKTSDRAQVNALLKSVTVPPVSFGIKREPHATRVMITAYLAGAWTRETTASHQQAWGILAPVGVEISQARDSGNSLSLLVSPLDFGYPVTLKMKNVDATIKGSDIVVPAAYVFYGLKNYPLAFGTGYSRGRSTDNPDQRVGRWVILFAFDMPLFKLH